MRTRVSTLLPLLAICVVSAAQAPAAGQQPTFRTGANYVRVDMYATADGRPVTDLTAGEIQILEDGVPQAIQDFEHVQVRPAGAQEIRVEPRGVDDSRQQAESARARVFVIFLDTYHTTAEGSVRMRLPLGRFLDRVLGPDDLVALMTPEMSARDITLGRKTTVISNLMQTEWWGRRGRMADADPKEILYDTCGSRLGMPLWAVEEMKARRREKLTLDALEDLVAHLGGIREERKAVLTVTEGWVLFEPNRALMEQAAVPATPPAFRPPIAPPSERGQVTDPLQIECEADRVALASMDHDFRLREVAEQANRGNVSFYPVYARGLAVFDSDPGLDPPPSIDDAPRPADAAGSDSDADPRSARRPLDTAPRQADPPLGAIDSAARLGRRQESLRYLAADTDGVPVINTNDIDGALKRITDDLSSYYLLGYYSTNTELDGRFRSITVRVTRPGIRVRSRRGYRGRTAEDVLSATAAAETPEASAVTSALNAVAAVNTRSPFRIRASSWTRRAGDGAAGSFWIVGELDFRTRRELAWTAGARAEIVVVAADGTPIESREVEVAAGDGAFDVRVPESGTLQPGEYAVRVRLEPESDAGAALTDLARVVVEAAAGPLGEAILWRRGPSTGPRHLRTADPRFQRSDRIRLELPVTAAAPDGPATARLLDRAGRPLPVPVQVSERAEPGGDTAWVVVDAALAPLAPGDYAIEVARGDARRVTAFSVVR